MHRTLCSMTRTLPWAMALAALAPSAQAEWLASSHYPFSLGFYESGITLPLRSDGGQELVVSAPEDGNYVLSFSAGCSAAGHSLQDWGGVQLDIRINGRVVPATAGSSDVLCTINTNGAFRPEMRSMVLPVTLQAGDNRIRVRAFFTQQAIGAQIGGQTVVVWR